MADGTYITVSCFKCTNKIYHIILHFATLCFLKLCMKSHISKLHSSFLIYHDPVKGCACSFCIYHAACDSKSIILEYFSMVR